MAVGTIENGAKQPPYKPSLIHYTLTEAYPQVALSTLIPMANADSFPILVVDDEPPISDLLIRIAGKEFPQARFISTRSPLETLDYLDQPAALRPRLVLLDIDLKQQRTGLDLLTDLRSRLGSAVPIIMLSVQDEEEKVQQAYANGAVAYTQKPDDLAGWQRYVRVLRDYWYTVAKLPIDT